MDEIINEFLKDQEKIEKNIEEFLKMEIELDDFDVTLDDLDLDITLDDFDVTLEDVNIEILEDVKLDNNN